MFTALKLGFCNSYFRSFSAVNYRSSAFSVNLKMSSKRLSSNLSNADISKLQKNVSNKATNCRRGISLGKECNNIENMTLQQMKSKLSETSAEGAKNEFVSELKSKIMDEGYAAQHQFIAEEKPAVVQTYSKRKAKGSPDEDHVQIKDNDSDTSGVTRENRRVKQSSLSVIDLKTCKSTRKEELVIESTEKEGETSKRVKRKVSSRTTTSSIKVHANVDIPVVEPWTVLTHKKPEKGWIAYNPKTIRPPPIGDGTDKIKLISWNVNGLRALLKLEGFSALELAKRENFDILCLQETKLQEKDVDKIRQSLLEGYDSSYWSCSVSKLGYSGTAVISRIKPLSVKYGLGISDHDTEGRLVTVEFDNFYLLSGYVPNSGDGLRRLSYRINQWDPALSNYMKELERSKPVILTGDLNCCHQEIDIWNPAGNRRSAGFTDEERLSFQTNFLEKGFVDTFRKQHPEVVGYTYWGYRHGGRKTNRGWRLDYFLASESIADKVYDSYILPDVAGSDHSPIGLILKL